MLIRSFIPNDFSLLELQQSNNECKDEVIVDVISTAGKHPFDSEHTILCVQTRLMSVNPFICTCIQRAAWF